MQHGATWGELAQKLGKEAAYIDQRWSASIWQNYRDEVPQVGNQRILASPPGPQRRMQSSSDVIEMRCWNSVRLLSAYLDIPQLRFTRAADISGTEMRRLGDVLIGVIETNKQTEAVQKKRITRYQHRLMSCTTVSQSSSHNSTTERAECEGLEWVSAGFSCNSRRV